MYSHHLYIIIAGCIPTANGCQSCSWSAEEGNMFFFPVSVRPSRAPSVCSFSTLRLNLVLIHEISLAFHDGDVHIYLHHRQPPSGHSRVHRVTQMRTARAFTAGSPLAVLAAVAAFRFQHGPIFMRLSFPTPTTTNNGM